MRPILKNKAASRPYFENSTQQLLKSKRSFEMSFGMLFAIIAGAVIIFLAIYATTRFIGTTKYTQYSEAAVALSNLMNPIVNGITSAYATSIGFRKETRVYLNCSTLTGKSPYFGAETLSFSEESGLISKWSEPGSEISRYNKYVFSNSVEQGKNLHIFAVPFYIGYRVDDLIMISMSNYCFVSAPGFIQKTVTNLGIENINLSETLTACPRSSVKVCFGFGSELTGCNISVDGNCNDIFCQSQYDSGTVAKQGGSIIYSGGLIYAAIFSSPEIYKCNIERLGKKAAELGQIYKEKSDVVKLQECHTLIGPYLDSIISMSGNLTMSKLANLNYQAKLMDEQNCQSNCPIYAPAAGAC